MKKLFPALVLLCLLAACAPSAESIQTAIAQTQTVWTPFPTQTPYPTYTPFPTIRVVPTRKINPTATASAGDHFAWNYLATQESGGIMLEIARLVIADKQTIGQDFDKYGKYEDYTIVGEIVFRVTNQSDKTISVYPDQGTVIVGSEQISLIDFMMLGTFGDDLGGEIYAGITKIDGIWFGIKRTPIDEIKSITIIIDAPNDDNFNTLGEKFNIVIDLSVRKNEPLPDELK
jgi:hypothetical protein